MLVTAFISLWISNTAAFAMMLPVVDAVVQELIKSNSEYHTSDDMNGKYCSNTFCYHHYI